MIKNILTIAGSDPSGGAGIQADLKTFSALGCYGMAAMTALTAQNTKGVRSIHMIPPDFLEDQLAALFDDIRIDAVKIGMAGTAETIKIIAATLKKYNYLHIVLDPVMVATSGDVLLPDDARHALIHELMPLAGIVTPNKAEAALILGSDTDVENAARALLHKGAKAALVKGGEESGSEAIDVLASDKGIQHFKAPKVQTQNTHGTGCTLSSAIACFLARGLALPSAVEEAKGYITHALSHADELNVGQGSGPVHHFYDQWRKK